MPATDSLAGTKISFVWRLLSSLALLPCGCAPLHAQTASQGGMRSGDAIRCASGKPQPAIVACTNIVNDKHESDEARAIARRNRAYQFQQAGDLDRAIADYTAALDRPEPRETQAKIRLNRGALYFQIGQEASALEDLGKALTLDPKLKSAYVTRATLLANRGDDAEALEDLNRALLLDPNDSAAS